MTTHHLSPIRVGFLLVPQFALMSYASSVEPLRAANRLSGRRPVRLARLLAGRRGRPRLQRCHDPAGPPGRGAGRSGPASGRRGRRRRSASIIPQPSPGSAPWRAAAPGSAASRAGRICWRAPGVLAGYRCTLHWEYIPGFVEQFPSLDVTGKLYEIDRDRLTCSGGVAALDMMHVLIEADHGAALAAAVSERYMHTSVRGGGDPQRMSPRERLGVAHPKLLAVAERMGEALEIAAVAQVARRPRRRVGAPARTAVPRPARQHDPCILSRPSPATGAPAPATHPAVDSRSRGGHRLREREPFFPRLFRALRTFADRRSAVRSKPVRSRRAFSQAASSRRSRTFT